jgi:hypothetical protein
MAAGMGADPEPREAAAEVTLADASSIDCSNLTVLVLYAQVASHSTRSVPGIANTLARSAVLTCWRAWPGR